MSDTALHFGTAGTLVGVLTQPDRSGGERPVVVIPNTYVTPHIGLFRMHVELARAFEVAGFASLRFDVSGIGDSADEPAPRPYAERAADDVDTAVAFAQEATGARDVVLVGHCDGGNHAFLAAARNEGVRGVVCIDAFMRPGWRYYAGLWARRIRGMFELERWRERFRARRGDDEPGALTLRSLGGEMPLYSKSGARDELREADRRLANRGTPAFFVFSGEYLERCVFADVREILALDAEAARNEHRILADAEHVYPELVHRRELVREVTDWVARRFGADA